jgi:hypothetical protein
MPNEASPRFGHLAVARPYQPSAESEVLILLGVATWQAGAIASARRNSRMNSRTGRHHVVEGAIPSCPTEMPCTTAVAKKERTSGVLGPGATRYGARKRHRADVGNGTGAKRENSSSTYPATSAAPWLTECPFLPSQRLYCGR